MTTTTTKAVEAAQARAETAAALVEQRKAERDRAAQRLADAKAAMREARQDAAAARRNPLSVYHGGPAPFGWRRVDGARSLELDDGEQLVIDRILALRRQKLSVAKIVVALSADTDCRGHAWHPTTVRRILARQAASA